MTGYFSSGMFFDTHLFLHKSLHEKNHSSRFNVRYIILYVGKDTLFYKKKPLTRLRCGKKVAVVYN
ncbi:hypothetical protein D7O18_26890 [Salmonella enterica subsp. enterica serovar Muenchen]|nr:hypothetical protein [Salmonella enterica subsp. enterica serovar Muenchen]